MKQHTLRCNCGKLEGKIDLAGSLNRALCYCKDCQAFAHFLGDKDILDAHGGSDIVQIRPGALTFTKGSEHLACMRLSPKGMLRWYARCCNTPIGNTPPDYHLAFVGLIHNCLDHDSTALEQAFGPVRVRVNLGGAKPVNGSMPTSTPLATLALFARFGAIMAGARISGSYRKTPFFSAEGEPVVVATVLSKAERKRLVSLSGKQ